MFRFSSVALAVLLLPAAALARGRPGVASDAFYVGVRVAPGAAMNAAWDLDIYFDRDRAVSIGPGVSLAVLGSGEPAGAEQELLLSADIARLKIGLNESGGEWRPFLMIAGGFSYTRLPAQSEDIVVTSGGGSPMVTVTRSFPALNEFAGIFTFGAGFELWSDGPWGLTFINQSHFHIGGDDRIPVVWTEFSIGVRFGL